MIGISHRNTLGVQAAQPSLEVCLKNILSTFIFNLRRFLNLQKTWEFAVAHLPPRKIKGPHLRGFLVVNCIHPLIRPAISWERRPLNSREKKSIGTVLVRF